MIAWKYQPGVHPHVRAGAAFAPHQAARCAGRFPHVLAVLTSAAVVALALSACANTDDNQVIPPVVVGMADTTAPLYDDGETQIYEVHSEVPLPMRRPTDEERKQLGKADPYPRAPFLLTGDVRIEIRYTLSNLGDSDINIELLLDPWNEFVRYVPGVIVTEERTTPNLSGYDKLIAVPAKSRVQGTITNDDTTELAIDLATAEAILANPPADPSVAVGSMINHVFNLQNRSNTGDPLITPYIPKLIAGLTGFDLGVRTYQKGNVAVEIVMDVTSVNGSHVLPPDSTEKPIGVPGTEISPPPPPQQT